MDVRLLLNGSLVIVVVVLLGITEAGNGASRLGEASAALDLLFYLLLRLFESLDSAFCLDLTFWLLNRIAGRGVVAIGGLLVILFELRWRFTFLLALADSVV